MDRKLLIRTSTLVLLSSLVPASNAAAQSEATPEPRVKVSRSMDVKLEGEFRATQTIRMEYKTSACKARLQLEYYQKGSEAHVKSTLTNDQCAASRGDYTIQVRYRNAEDVVETAEYPETWERTDSAPVVRERDFPIPDNVDVIRVKSRGLSCECIAAAPADEDVTDPADQ